MMYIMINLIILNWDLEKHFTIAETNKKIKLEHIRKYELLE